MRTDSKLPRKSDVSTSTAASGSASRSAAIVRANCSAPPSSRSSRVTHVTTTCFNPIFFAASATERGSSADGGAYGRPVVTLQKPQERVQTSPRIMKVAVPREKHSLRFGQASDSQTECSDFSRSSDLISCRSRRLTFFSRIQSGRRADIEDIVAKQNRRPFRAAVDLRLVQCAGSVTAERLLQRAGD